MSVTAHRPRAADRISRLTGARHARGPPRHGLLLGGSRPVAARGTAVRSSRLRALCQDIHDLHLRDARR